MTIRRMFYAFLGLVICLAVLISYRMPEHSGLFRPLLGSSWLFRFGANRSVRCLDELLFAFGINTLNLFEPTYVRLPNPVPIVSECSHLFAKPSESLANFRKRENLSPAEQSTIHSIMNQLAANFSKQNLELFLAGGSLLGSVRHFGFFPWDADADVMILVKQKAKVRKFLIDLSASDEFRFVDAERSTGHWQLGIFCQAVRNKPHIRMYGTKQLYPVKQCRTIVDFFFGWTEENQYKRGENPFSFPISDVYPLTLQPFGPYLLPAPRSPTKFVAAVYGADFEEKCFMKYFGYKTLNCSSLHSIYPFVTHLRLPYNGIALEVNVLVHKAHMQSLFVAQTLIS